MIESLAHEMKIWQLTGCPLLAFGEGSAFAIQSSLHSAVHTTTGIDNLY